MTKAVVKELYNKLYTHAKKRSKLQKHFDEQCREQYGFIFQDCDFSIDINQDLKLKDSDKIIDTLDYGTDCLPFEEFDKMMLIAKRILEERGMTMII